MSFGFPVRDFISALELTGTVINALRGSKESGPQYRELVNQLYSLETALLHVKQLELEEEQRSEYIALRQSAAQCQRAIDSFWKKIQHYQKHLRTGGSTSKLKDGWMKVKWAMCEQDDLARFKADLAAHTQTIITIIEALQMKNLKNQDRRRVAEHKAISTIIQDATFRCMAKLVEMSAAIGHGVALGQEIIQNTAKIMATNIKIFQIVLSIQNIITQIPGQVERQQPVYMIDALGRQAPFYLEFIRSKEVSQFRMKDRPCSRSRARALQAVLKINFENIPSGPRKIDNGEFLLLDTPTKRQINLSKQWDACFMHGQRIEMRMIFQKQTRRLNSCPSCGYTSEQQTDEDIECVNCGLTFKRVIQIEEPPTDLQACPKKKGVRDLRDLSAALSYDRRTSENLGPPRPPITAYDEAEDVKYYRRVNVVQRQRRAVWESQVDTNPEINEASRENNDNEDELVLEAAAAEEMSDVGDSEDIDLFGDAVDAMTFDQILEMDDSEDEMEREFSKSIMLGGLESIERVIRQIQGTLYDNSNDTPLIASLTHFGKGECRARGIAKVGDIMGEMQDTIMSKSLSDNEVIPIITRLLGEVKIAFVDAHDKLRVFYREPQREIEW